MNFEEYYFSAERASDEYGDLKLFWRTEMNTTENTATCMVKILTSSFRFFYLLQLLSSILSYSET